MSWITSTTAQARIVASVAVLAASLVACTSGKSAASSTARSSNASSSSAVPTPAPGTGTANAQEALAAARRFSAYVNTVFEHPTSYNATKAATMATSSALSNVAQAAQILTQNKLEFRGTPPTIDMFIVTEKLQAQQPQVVVAACIAKGTDWRTYSTTNSQPTGSTSDPSGTAPRPWKETWIVVLQHGNWLAIDDTTDTSKTCTR